MNREASLRPSSSRCIVKLEEIKVKLEEEMDRNQHSADEPGPSGNSGAAVQSEQETKISYQPQQGAGKNDNSEAGDVGSLEEEAEKTSPVINRRKKIKIAKNKERNNKMCKEGALQRKKLNKVFEAIPYESD